MSRMHVKGIVDVSPIRKQSVGRKIYSFKKDVFGRFVLIAIGWAEDIKGCSNGKELEETLIPLIGAFWPHFEKIVGKPLEASTLESRRYNMHHIYDHKTRVGKKVDKSDEHYLKHFALKPHVSAVFAELELGRPISLERMAQVMNQKVEKKEKKNSESLIQLERECHEMKRACHEMINASDKMINRIAEFKNK